MKIGYTQSPAGRLEIRTLVFCCQEMAVRVLSHIIQISVDETPGKTALMIAMVIKSGDSEAVEEITYCHKCGKKIEATNIKPQPQEAQNVQS